MNELVAQNTDMVDSIGMTDEISWTPPSDLTMERYLEIGHTFQQIQKSLSWWYGDLLNTGERLFGEEFAQAVDDSGKALETLIKYKAVANRIPREIRRKELSWTSHFYCAYIEIEHRGPLLELALNVGLSSRELKEVTKLSFELRADIIAAAKEGMDHDTFMQTLNRFKLGEIKPSTPKKERELEIDPDDDEEIPFTDLDDEDDDGARPVPKRQGLDSETVMDFWENNNAPLIVCSPSEAIWDGILVRAAQDDDGRVILVWEEMMT